MLQLRLGQRIEVGANKKRREIAHGIRHIVCQYDEYMDWSDTSTLLKNVEYYMIF